MKYKKGNSDDIGKAGRKDKRKYQKHLIMEWKMFVKRTILLRIWIHGNMNNILTKILHIL